MARSIGGIDVPTMGRALARARLRISVTLRPVALAVVPSGDDEPGSSLASAARIPFPISGPNRPSSLGNNVDDDSVSERDEAVVMEVFGRYESA
jgi:hypothetical protein